MTLKEAIKIFNNHFPERKIIGYWRRPTGFIFNTRSPYNRLEPDQYCVTNDGNIYATNPYESDLDISDMIIMK